MRRDGGDSVGFSLYSADRGTSRDRPERDPKSRDKISKAARLFGAVHREAPLDSSATLSRFLLPHGVPTKWCAISPSSGLLCSYLILGIQAAAQVISNSGHEDMIVRMGGLLREGCNWRR